MHVYYYLVGHPVSACNLQGVESAGPTVSSSSPLPSDMVKDKAVGTTKSTVTAPISPDAGTISASSSDPSPSLQHFEEEDMICIKGAEDKGKGVIRWVGTLPGVDGPVAGIEMVLLHVIEYIWQAFLHVQCSLDHPTPLGPRQVHIIKAHSFILGAHRILVYVIR